MSTEHKLQKLAKIAADKIFAQRGGHSEVHASKADLTEILSAVLVAVAEALGEGRQPRNRHGFFSAADLTHAGCLSGVSGEPREEKACQGKGARAGRLNLANFGALHLVPTNSGLMLAGERPGKPGYFAVVVPGHEETAGAFVRECADVLATLALVDETLDGFESTALRDLGLNVIAERVKGHVSDEKEVA